MIGIDADSLAFSMLRETDMVGLRRPRMTHVAVRLGLEFSLDVPLGCESWFEPWKRIHITPYYNEAHLQAQAGHELGHAGLTSIGMPKSQQELYADNVKLALQMPQYAVRKLAQRHGFSPQMFIQFYRDAAPPSEVIQRAAWLCGTPVILHSNVLGRVAITETQEGCAELELSAKDERKILQRVRETGRWELSGLGVIAYPWRLGRHKGIAITFDMRHSLSRYVSGWEAAE